MFNTYQGFCKFEAAHEEAQRLFWNLSSKQEINPLSIREACLRKNDQFFNQTSNLDPPGA